jgi:hypothetical protein
MADETPPSAAGHGRYEFAAWVAADSYRLPPLASPPSPGLNGSDVPIRVAWERLKVWETTERTNVPHQRT